MKKIILKYGLYGAAIAVGVPLLSSLIIGTGPDSYSTGEIVGYTSIIVAMSLVYFAMRVYRDKENDGKISFGQSLQIGTLISVLGGIAFAVYNLIFVLWVDPEFNEKYFAYQMGLERGTAEFEKQFSSMMESGGFMYSTLGGTITMFMTVFLIGFVLSVISSLILKTKQVQTA